MSSQLLSSSFSSEEDTVLILEDINTSFETDCIRISNTGTGTGTHLHLMQESTFGAFGKEYESPMPMPMDQISAINSDGNDDSYIMGDEELQIVNLTACAGSVGVRDPCVSILNPLSLSLPVSVSISSPTRSVNNSESLTSDGFDVCREYGYKYEYTEDDDDDDDDNSTDDDVHDDDRESNTQSLLSKLRIRPLPSSQSNNINNSSNAQHDHEISYQTHILGKTYDPVNDYHAKRDDEANLFWFTYRCDFFEIKPYAITSDAGWGCMLRSAQMLLAQAMRMHWKGRRYRAERSLVKRREDLFLTDLLTWFADYPSSGTCTSSGDFGGESWYSLHNMVAAGVARYDVLPGEWFGPGTACHVLRDLVELHSRALENDITHNGNETERYIHTSKGGDDDDNENENGSTIESERPNALKVYIAPEGTIYQSDLRDLLVKRTATNIDTDNAKETKKQPKEKDQSSKEEFNDDDNDNPQVVFHPLYESPITKKDDETEKEVWDASLLILIPLRLGLKQFNASTYKVPLAHMMSFPQSVGFVGGAPRHALWFYGANSDGSKVFGLDPHTVQRAPRRRRVSVGPQELNGGGGDDDGVGDTSAAARSRGRRATRTHEIVFTDEYLRSINCSNTSTMDMTRIDPSLALGFYCRDREDYESFCSLLKLMKNDERLKDYPELFTIADAKPNYDADVSSAMLDMMMSSSSQLLDGGDLLDDAGKADDDDEYIML